MSMGRYDRQVRSGPALNPALLAFIAIYVSIVALSFAAVWALASRLPVEARQVASFPPEGELIAIVVYLALIALPRANRMRYALETILPIGLSMLGAYAAILTATLWFNLDATVSRMPMAFLPGIGLILCGTFAGWLVGRYLGGLAVSGRLRREAASSRRSAWFAETSPDGSWRRASGVTTGLITLPLLLLTQATSPAYAPGSPLPLQPLLIGSWAFAVVVGDHATISISDAAVKVRTRSWLSNNAGWSVSLSEIARAEAVTDRPKPLIFDRNRIALRAGPALEIRTVTGGRYSVSLDEAGEAVAVIEALRSGASPDVSEAEDSGSEAWSATR
jgi:hypothetical protein